MIHLKSEVFLDCKIARSLFIVSCTNARSLTEKFGASEEIESEIVKRLLRLFLTLHARCENPHFRVLRTL